MMNVYRFSADGLALGAVIVVVSESSIKAFSKACQWARDNALDPDSVDLQSVTPLGSPMVVYGWNGDY